MWRNDCTRFHSTEILFNDFVRPVAEPRSKYHDKQIKSPKTIEVQKPAGNRQIQVVNEVLVH